ncbi:MAG: diguanylate cyclase [Synechococcus sp.]|nr:diguanylate cyclase [Synechococcus sp.]
MVELIDISEIVAKSDYLQAAAAAGVVGVWDWNLASDVLTWDPVMYRLFGRSPDCGAAPAAIWDESVHPDDQPAVLDEVHRALRGEREFAGQFRVVWPDGSVHHIRGASRPSFDDQGRPLRMLGVNYDVTPLVQAQESLAAEQERLRTTLDSLLDPHLMLGPVLDGEGRIHDLRILRANPAAAAYNRMPLEEFVGRTIRDFWPGHVSNGLFALYLEVLRTGEPLLLDDFCYEHEIVGEARHFDIRAVKVGDELSVTWRDVTERAEAQRRLAASEQQFRLLAENSSDVVCHLSADRQVVWVSPSLATVLGYAPGQWIGRPIHDVLATLEADPLPVWLEASWTEVAPQSRHLRLRVRGSEGSHHWIETRWTPFLNAAGEPDGEVCTCRLIDNEVAAERELERRAATDSLTALLNREEVFRQIRGLTAGNQRTGQELAVLFCDLDHFKDVNDTFGHQAGDAVLLAMAERVRHCLRASDLAARVGGDELLVVLPGLQTLEDALAIAEKLRQLAREPVEIPEGEVRITLSVGVALAKGQESIDDLIARADAAMYAAKQQGRDQVVAITAGS